MNGLLIEHLIKRINATEWLNEHIIIEAIWKIGDFNNTRAYITLL